MSSKEISRLYPSVIDHILRHADDRDWWERGAAITAVLRIGEERQKTAIARWIHRSVDRQTSAGYLANDERDELPTGHLRIATPTAANATSFGFPLLLLYRETGDTRLLNAAKLHAQALVSTTPRTREGGIPLRKEAPELWVDMSYIMVPFLVLLGKLTDDPTLIDEGLLQLRLIAKHLVDPHQHLARHVWCETPNHFPQSTFWARGNGWLVAGLVDVLEIVGEHDAAAKLNELLVRVLTAMRALQDRSGYLRHVLDDEHARFEASGTLMFAYAALKASRLGLVDRAFGDAGARALRIVAGSVKEDGEVPGVAVPPGGPGVPFSHSPIGQGFFLLAAAELEFSEKG